MVGEILGGHLQWFTVLSEHAYLVSDIWDLLKFRTPRWAPWPVLVVPAPERLRQDD